MAGARVGYKRTFQTRQYESQVVELSVEMDVGDESLTNVKVAMRRLYADLDKIGDALMAEALAKPDARDAPRSGR